MKAVVAEIEKTCVKSHRDERDDHGRGTSKRTPWSRRIRR
jgi:hypothetical protein